MRLGIAGASSAPPVFVFRSVDAVTRDLPGTRIEDETPRLPGRIALEGHAGVVAAIHEELVARHGDDRGPLSLLKIEDRQVSVGLDLKLAILDGGLKIGPRPWRTDHGADNRQLDRLHMSLA